MMTISDWHDLYYRDCGKPAVPALAAVTVTVTDTVTASQCRGQ
jgi:hypothetical protein